MVEMEEPRETIEGGKAWYYCGTPMILGEAPIYRESDSTLHWVDCLAQPPELHVLHVDPVTGEAEGRARVVKLSDSVTVQFFRKKQPGSYICAYYQGVAFMDEKTGKLDILKEIIATENRDKLRLMMAALMQEAASEAYGKPIGRLWRYDPDGSLHEMDKGFICGNGLAWSPDNKYMYFNDSVAMKVFRYDFDLEAGMIFNRKLFIDRRPTYGEPDGMVVDVEGNLWIAMFASYRVMVFDPTGKHIKDILLSAYNPACTTWGGKDWNILFVATGKDRLNAAGPDDEGGHMFRYIAPQGVKGFPKHEFLG